MINDNENYPSENHHPENKQPFLPPSIELVEIINGNPKHDTIDQHTQKN